MLPGSWRPAQWRCRARSPRRRRQRVIRVAPGDGGRGILIDGGPRAAIGVSTSSAATSRDTLGVLVSSVRSGSPAEKAGIAEGNRIASINGVSLKLSAARTSATTRWPTR